MLSAINLLTKPVLVHTHGNDVFTVPDINYGIRRSAAGKWMSSFTWKNADKIIAVCKKSKNEIDLTLQKDNVNKHNTVLLHNGVDEVLFSRDVYDTNVADGKKLRGDADFVFITMASLVPVKNQF